MAAAANGGGDLFPFFFSFIIKFHKMQKITIHKIMMAHFAFVKMRRVCVDPFNTCEGRFKTHTLRNNSDGPPGSTNTFYGTDRWADSRSVQYGRSSCT